MKTCKKLLAVTIALVLLVSTLVSGLVVSAADAHSVVIGNTTFTAGEDATVEFTVDFAGEEMNALHMLTTIDTDLEIAAAQIVSVDYAGDVTDPGDDELEVPYLRIKDDGKNLAAGKILFESGVDGAVKATKVVFSVTFAAIAEGTYPIAINVESTNYEEADFADLTASAEIVAKAAHVCEEGTPVDNGDGTHDVPCTGCDVLIKDDEAHNFVDGACDVCGAKEPVTGPVVDDRLTVYRTSLAYGTSSLELNFRMTTDVLDLYDDVELVIIPQKYDLTTLDLVENPTEYVFKKDELTVAGKYRSCKYTDIYLYELGLDINYMFRCYDAEDNLVAVSETFTTTAAQYLKTESLNTVNALAFRTLMVDTLIVCDEVMKNVAATYKDSDLAKAVAAGSVLDGVDTSIATQTVGECNAVDSFNSFNADYLYKTGTHAVRSSVAVGKVPYINFRIQDKNKVLDLNKLTVTVNYTSKDSAGEHPYERVFTVEDFTWAGNYIQCQFAEIGFHDSDKDIVFTVEYDGVKVCDWTYSIESYLSTMTSNETLGSQMTALIKLGQSFRSYQGL